MIARFYVLNGPLRHTAVCENAPLKTYWIFRMLYESGVNRNRSANTLLLFKIES